jgi:hypothetical protein
MEKACIANLKSKEYEILQLFNLRFGLKAVLITLLGYVV